MWRNPFGYQKDFCRLTLQARAQSIKLVQYYFLSINFLLKGQWLPLCPLLLKMLFFHKIKLFYSGTPLSKKIWEDSSSLVSEPRGYSKYTRTSSPNKILLCWLTWLSSKHRGIQTRIITWSPFRRESPLKTTAYTRLAQGARLCPGSRGQRVWNCHGGQRNATTKKRLNNVKKQVSWNSFIVLKKLKDPSACLGSVIPA